MLSFCRWVRAVLLQTVSSSHFSETPRPLSEPFCLYVYPTVLRRVQQAPKTNCRRGRMSKIKQRPGGSQRESQQQACIAAARSRSTRGFLVHQVACTAQTQTESWAPPNFWQQDASTCRWVYVYSCTFALWLHLLPAFSSGSRISRSLLCFSPCAY